MKIGLVTTTINEPRVLELYRKLSYDTRFFVVGDLKTPHAELLAVKEQLNTGAAWYRNDPKYKDDPFTHWACDTFSYYSPEDQKALNYKSSDLIGWNTDSRRNIALLEAIKWGAEVIISIDDDMVPLHNDFFTHIDTVFSQSFSGLQLGAPGYWFDAGQFTNPPARQRGLPAEYAIVSNPGFVHNVSIGALQGSILGVPDTDAMTAIVNRPVITSMTSTLEAGFVVDPAAYSVFNSQITAFRRELAPAFFQFYKAQGRNTDIIASVIMRRVMRDRGLYTYYGKPVGYHARQKRPLINDLKAELWGIENIEAFQEFMDSTRNPGQTVHGPVTAQLRTMYACLPEKICSPEMRACALAWLEDCEAVL